jgi:hypothetical protein
MKCKRLDPAMVERVRELSPGELLDACVKLAVEDLGPGKDTLAYLRRTQELYAQACEELGVNTDRIAE